MIRLTPKKQIRTEIKKKRSQLSPNDRKLKDEQIYQSVIQSDEFTRAANILIYLNTDEEVSTTNIIRKAWELGKQVAAPKTNNQQMDFYVFSSFSELEIGPYGILEPTNEKLIESHDGLVIMPGVVFDYNRNRIGYGGGYYDRYLSSHTIFKSIALAYECQLIEQIPYDEYDIKPNIIITESQILK